MEIIQVTTITLEKAEVSALQTLKAAYMQCVCDDCFSCEKCPLYVDDICIGKFAERALDNLKV